MVSGSQPRTAFGPSPVTASGSGNRPSSAYFLAVVGEMPIRVAMPERVR